MGVHRPSGFVASSVNNKYSRQTAVSDTRSAKKINYHTVSRPRAEIIMIILFHTSLEPSLGAQYVDE